MKVNLLTKKNIANDTLSLFLEKPDGFRFNPGQTVDLIIPSLREGRELSIASSPQEKHIEVAFRLRDSEYKKYLNSAPEGTALEIVGPYGKLDLGKETAIYIAGGIGIAPYMGALRNGVKKKTWLFYSNRSLSDTPYLDELRTLEKNNSMFKLIPTMTGSKFWKGEKGRVNYNMVKKYVSDLDSYTIYITGSCEMVADVARNLGESGVSYNKIVTDCFCGY